jgi:uncharacterized alkaline shock family protein YloU
VVLDISYYNIEEAGVLNVNEIDAVNGSAEIKNVDSIVISDEVMEKIAGIAIDEVEGAILTGGTGGIGNFLSRKNLTKGIKIETREDEIVVSVSVIVEFGSKIQKIANDIQLNIRERLEAMTGMKVIAINVSVIDVQMKKSLKKMNLDEKVAIYENGNENKKSDI